MRDVGTILTVIVAVIILVSGLLSWYRAMNDEDMDKSDIFRGCYLFEYPIYTISLIIGVVLFFQESYSVEQHRFCHTEIN